MRIPWAITSGPMPSPGMTAIFLLTGGGLSHATSRVFTHPAEPKAIPDVGLVIGDLFNADVSDFSLGYL
jgi:hypothetical protein